MDKQKQKVKVRNDLTGKVFGITIKFNNGYLRYYDTLKPQYVLDSLTIINEK